MEELLRCPRSLLACARPAGTDPSLHADVSSIPDQLVVHTRGQLPLAARKEVLDERTRVGIEAVGASSESERDYGQFNYVITKSIQKAG